MGSIIDVWKLNDIERKADEAKRRLYELDALRGNVDSLERENREISAAVNGLRLELETLREDMRQITERLTPQE